MDKHIRAQRPFVSCKVKERNLIVVNNECPWIGRIQRQIKFQFFHSEKSRGAISNVWTNAVKPSFNKLERFEIFSL